MNKMIIKKSILIQWFDLSEWVGADLCVRPNDAWINGGQTRRSAPTHVQKLEDGIVRVTL